MRARLSSSVSKNVDVPNPTLSVVAVDDHPMLLRGIAAAITESAPDILVTHVAANVDEMLARVEQPVDVALLDLALGVETDFADNIRRLGTVSRYVLVFTSEERAVPLRRAIEAGAAGILLKIDPVDAIIAAIRRAAAGEVSCSSTLAVALLETAGEVHLSERQAQIIAKIADGLPYKAIARQLAISQDTVQEHLKRAFAAYRNSGYDVGNAHSLVAHAMRDGHLDPPGPSLRSRDDN